jgi:hypothetical protein
MGASVRAVIPDWGGGYHCRLASVLPKRQTISEDKICKLENRVMVRACRKLLYDSIMSGRGTISRICLI